MWLTPRKDSLNQARADVPGRMMQAPAEVWRMPTGGDVRFAAPVTVAGQDAVLIQVGTTLQLARPTGETIWQDLTLNAGTVLKVADFDGEGPQEALVRTDARSVTLVDVATGRRLWSWQCAPSQQISGHAFERRRSGLRFICFPSYSADGYCFDFAGSREQPRLVWQRSYPGKYGVGYGPSIVLADMDRDGAPDIVLSGKVPSIYQAVINAEDGEIKFEAQHDLGGWGRPYGLLQTADIDADGWPDVLMASCQVEEYVAVARNEQGAGLKMLWGHFVEKDWPTDRLELRPQVTSLADLTGTGKIELVVGLWQDGRWQTPVIDPLKGFEARRGALEGRYFWGCHDVVGDSRREIIVSVESDRRPADCATLQAIDGISLKPVAELADAAVLWSADSAMPEDRYFMALRRSPIFMQADGGARGILVRRFNEGNPSGVCLWGTKSDGSIGCRLLAEGAYRRADSGRGGLVLCDPCGTLQFFDDRLHARNQKLGTNGRVCQPLVWEAAGKRELVVDTAGGVVMGGAPDLSRNGKLAHGWRIAGADPVLHVAETGAGRLAARHNGGSRGVALIYRAPVVTGRRSIRVDLPNPLYARAPLLAYGKQAYRLLANRQTGVHTFAMTILDESGHALWHDDAWGAYPNAAAAGDLDGDGLPEMVADDHGVLRVYDAKGSVLARDPGWPPAYNLPVIGAFGPGNAMAVLRSSGIQGLSLLDRAGKTVWKTPAPIWRYYRSLGAIADVSGDGSQSLGILTEEGLLDCINLADGTVRWSVDVGTAPNGTSVVAGDLDGDGTDEFLTGLQDGRLVCVGLSYGKPGILWETHLGASAANPIIADVDGDGVAEIVVSTSDGYVRILR